MMVWERFPQIPPILILKLVAISLLGNRFAVKFTQVIQPFTVFVCQSREEEDGGIKALPTVNGISEKDRMEFDGGGEASASLR